MPGRTVEHVPAGPAKVLPKDKLLPHMSAFGRYLANHWGRDTPDVVHAHFWMSGLAALDGAREHGVPVVQTFHALGVVERRHQGAADTSPESRIRTEVAIARDVAAVLATSSDEERELARLGVPAHRISVIPCGVNVSAFRPDGPASRRRATPRVLAAGRLVKRTGFDTIVQALPDVPGAELIIAGGPPARRRRVPSRRCRRRARPGPLLLGTDRPRHCGGVRAGPRSRPRGPDRPADRMSR